MSLSLYIVGPRTAQFVSVTLPGTSNVPSIPLKLDPVIVLCVYMQRALSIGIVTKYRKYPKQLVYIQSFD